MTVAVFKSAVGVIDMRELQFVNTLEREPKASALGADPLTSASESSSSESSSSSVSEMQTVVGAYCGRGTGRIETAGADAGAAGTGAGAGAGAGSSVAIVVGFPPTSPALTSSDCPLARRPATAMTSDSAPASADEPPADRALTTPCAHMTDVATSAAARAPTRGDPPKCDESVSADARAEGSSSKSARMAARAAGAASPAASATDWTSKETDGPEAPAMREGDVTPAPAQADTVGDAHAALASGAVYSVRANELVTAVAAAAPAASANNDSNETTGPLPTFVSLACASTAHPPALARAAAKTRAASAATAGAAAARAEAATASRAATPVHDVHKIASLDCDLPSADATEKTTSATPPLSASGSAPASAPK